MKSTAVLVHGTFAQGAPWTRPGSSIVAALTDSLGEKWNVEHFDWSGGNSYQARETAAKDLADRIDFLVGDSHTSRAIVVAHSHGGNVALRALRMMKHSHRIAGVVALGTPFLKVEHKQWSPTLLYAMSASAWMVILSNGIIGDYINLRSAWGFLVQVAAFIIATVILYIPLRRAKQEAKAIALASYRPDSGNVPLLIVRHSFDEAGLWLRALLIPRFFEGMLNIFGRMFIGTNWLVKLIWIIGLSFIFVSLLGVRFIPFIDIFFIATILLVLSIPPLSAAATLLSAHRFGFGGRLSLKHLFVQVGLAEGMQEQGAQIVKYSGVAGMVRAASSKSGRLPTPHSLGYTDPSSISRVANWLKHLP